MSELDPAAGRLGLGEREAIALMLSAPADVLLSDDTAARSAARICKVGVAGTIGVLYEAAKNSDIEFSASEFDSAIERLKLTSFHFSSAFQRSIEDLSSDLRQHLV